MSFILDALRKSDRERALGNVPRLDTLQPVEAGRRPVVAWLAAVLVLLLGAAAAWWWWPIAGPVSRNVPQAVITELPVAQQPAAAAVAVPPASVGPPAAVEPSSPVAAPETPVVAVGQLPADLRRALPELTVNVLSWSGDPERRFVMIDLQVYREGEVMKSGPRVERISADAVLLSYRGYRFEVRP